MPLLDSIKGNLSYAKREGRKKWLAFLRACNLEYVRTREAGGARVVTRLVKVRGAEPATPSSSIEPDPRRFFCVEIEVRPGINHLRHALELLVREAVSLGRTPVAFKPLFDPRHNLGHDLDVGWDTYIDLDHVEILNEAGVATGVRVAQLHEVPQCERLSALWVDREHVISAAENCAVDIIFRQNRSGLHVEGLHDGGFGLPGHWVRFAPAASVRDRCRVVRDALGDYCAMHIRRDDILEMNDLYPNVDRDTQPERILATLRQHLVPHAKVYIMTNERDGAFFDPLRSEFRVFQYFDFPVLRELIESDRPDNFLLFEIEKLLFEGASTKVHTFSHPEGGARIALSLDKGWA